MELKLNERKQMPNVLLTFNRTKWNWNLFSTILLIFCSILLIVLNGIEMKHRRSNNQTTGTFNRTKWNWNQLFMIDGDIASGLLIVLNGIEILPIRGYNRRLAELLIVLNGIENHKNNRTKLHYRTFNRTKWNWNTIVESTFTNATGF